MMTSSCGCSAHNGFLTAKGLEEAAQRLSLEGLAPRGELEYVDIPLSVSALRRDEIKMIFDDAVIDEQHRRFHNEYFTGEACLPDRSA